MKWGITALLLLLSNLSFADCVILIHGLGRSDTSMKSIEKTLTQADYTVINTRYSAKGKTVSELAQDVIPQALKQCPGNTPIHFVTHSLGGILLREYLSQQTIPELNRVVMLGPPNQGSEVADTLKGSPLHFFLKNETVLELGTDKNSKPKTLSSIDAELGIIAGKQSINLILSSIIPGRDDGKVSVENTKLEGMKDHIIVPINHTFMMKNREVITQITYFLEHGEFIRNRTKNNRLRTHKK